MSLPIISREAAGSGRWRVNREVVAVRTPGLPGGIYKTGWSASILKLGATWGAMEGDQRGFDASLDVVGGHSFLYWKKRTECYDPNQDKKEYHPFLYGDEDDEEE